MGNTIEEEIIRNRIPIHNYLIIILKFIFIVFSLIIFFYNYTSYYSNNGIITKVDDRYYLKVKVLIDDIQNIKLNNQLKINNHMYQYKCKDLDNNLYIDNNRNYKYLFLEVSTNQFNQENYLIDFKIELKKQTILKYLLQIIGGN